MMSLLDGDLGGSPLSDIFSTGVGWKKFARQVGDSGEKLTRVVIKNKSAGNCWVHTMSV